MPLIRYQTKRFKTDSLRIIQQANAIIGEWAGQGYTLTLRQLYYQFVAKGLIPNNMKSYKRIGSIINDARVAGKIDWNAIEDRTRALESLSTWDNGSSILHDASTSFKYDRWEDQPTRIEIWIEKEALSGVIERIAHEYRVPFFACRGYVSQSEQWRAGRRFKEYNEYGQNVLVLHLGDHDPSGIDMTRDNRTRLEMFAEYGDVEIRRLALNWNQIEEFNPPPNPAKMTDSRAKEYVRKFGRQSWELDALNPDVMHTLIRDNIVERIEYPERWNAQIKREKKTQGKLMKLAQSWKEDKYESA